MTQRVQMSEERLAPSATRRRFTHRVLITVGIVALAVALGALLYIAANVLLLAFAGVLLGVVLDGLSRWVSQRTPLSHGWALALVVTVLVALLAGTGWVIGPRIAAQVDQLSQQMPQSFGQFEQSLRQYGWGQYLLAQIPDTSSLLQNSSQLLTRASTIASSLASLLGGLIIILFVGLYVAANPKLYYEGLVRLFPTSRRDRAREVLGELGATLRWWMVGQLISMTLIGVLSGVGLWLLGVPLALTLGLIAGLTEFVPTFGPYIGGIPAVLLALTQSPTTALWVVLLYVGIQFVEGNIILPLVQKRAVDLPPALTLLAQILLGLVFGFLGLLLAVPLVAVTLVLVRMLYVEDVLERRGARRYQAEEPVVAAQD